ncbi:hypothetical protein Bca52824_018439 [Brassica carinata]|uniref:Uncharacterized protein n=1 Tax=Brassica carinata TaxID=52824 RepID=A0A8X7VQH3_BRACI|nr:hypothetical protein Bca52824_018439 [Brassica carinata]
MVYEAPLGYSIEDVHLNGGIKKFKSSVYSNIRFDWSPNPIVLKSCRSYNKVRWLCLQIGFEGYEKQLEVSPSSSPHMSESGSKAADPGWTSPEPTTKKPLRCNNLE